MWPRTSRADRPVSALHCPGSVPDSWGLSATEREVRDSSMLHCEGSTPTTPLPTTFSDTSPVSVLHSAGREPTSDVVPPREREVRPVREPRDTGTEPVEPVGMLTRSMLVTTPLVHVMPTHRGLVQGLVPVTQEDKAAGLPSSILAASRAAQ